MPGGLYWFLISKDIIHIKYTNCAEWAGYIESSETFSPFINKKKKEKEINKNISPFICICCDMFPESRNAPNRFQSE